MVVRLVILATIVGFGGRAQANEFIGWCFVNECVGEAPITEEGFFTCEENCTMTNPVRVTGMDGTLFDVSCVGDYRSYQQRMLLMKYTDHEGSQKALAVSSDGPLELERCM